MSIIDRLRDTDLGEYELRSTHSARVIRNSHDAADTIEKLVKVIRTTLDAVAEYPEHPMTASEVMLRQALYGVEEKPKIPSFRAFHIERTGAWPGYPHQRTNDVFMSLCESVADYVEEVVRKK